MVQRNPNDLSGCTSQRKQAGCHLVVKFLHEPCPYPRGCCQPLLAILKYKFDHFRHSITGWGEELKYISIYFPSCFCYIRLIFCRFFFFFFFFEGGLIAVFVRFITSRDRFGLQTCVMISYQFINQRRYFMSGSAFPSLSPTWLNTRP